MVAVLQLVLTPSQWLFLSIAGIAFFCGSLLWLKTLFSAPSPNPQPLRPLQARFLALILCGSAFFIIPPLINGLRIQQRLPTNNPTEEVLWSAFITESLLVLFFLCVVHFCASFRDGLNANSYRWRHFWTTCVGLCKSLPLVMAIAIVWIYGLIGLQYLGISFKLEPQPVVQLLIQQDLRASGLFAIGSSAVVLAPICEEIFFRGFLLRFFQRFLSTTGSIWLTSILFAGMHQSLTVFGPLVALSNLLGYFYVKTGHIGVSISIHGLFNALNLTGIILFANGIRG